MTQILGTLGIALIAVWVIARMLYLGPIEDVADLAVTWLTGLMGVSAVIAALTVLGCGLVMGRTSAAWLRFVHRARTIATIIGCALVIVGLLRYLDTEPQGEITWLVLGLVVLAGAAVVHGWVAVTERRNLT